VKEVSEKKTTDRLTLLIMLMLYKSGVLQKEKFMEYV